MSHHDSETERRQLESLYAGLTEEVLIKIGSQYDSLTDTAQSVLRAEFDRRGLPAPELENPPATFEFQELVTVRRFRDLPAAMAAQSVLDSAGIPLLLKDENTVRMDWMWSNLLGGIRLQVRSEDLEDAESLLSQPVPEIIELGDGESYDQPRCPRCQSHDIGLDAPLMIPLNNWLCHKCGGTWEGPISD